MLGLKKVLVSGVALLVIGQSMAYGPFEVRDFEYYISQSPSRASYSRFTFYDETSGTKARCEYQPSRPYDPATPPSTILPLDYVKCRNKEVKWKYAEPGQQVYVEFGYYQPNEYTGGSDWVRILANGTISPSACKPYGSYGFKCAPIGTKRLTDYAAVI